MSTQLDLPVIERITDALQWGILENINPQDGYYFNMEDGEVNLMQKSFPERKKWPSIDLIWDTDNFTSTVSGGHSHGGSFKIAPLLIEAYLNQTGADAWRYQLRFKADIEKFFGTYFKIEDKNGNATAFNSAIQSSKPFGLAENRPHVGVDVRVLIYYRTEQANPAQSY